MVQYFGDFAEDDTVLIPFNTFDSNDPSASVTITNLADADIMVHKDGGLTQIVTDGATVVINFDSITGNHMVTIDTSAHADYSVGSEYAVRIEGTTVDGATINAWIGAFSIERAGGALAVAKLIQTAVIMNAAGDDVAADIIAMKSVVDTRMAEASINTTTGAINVVTLVDTTTTNTDMVGTNDAALATELAILTDATILTSVTIETVTDQLNFIIPADADATDDDAYNNAVAVFIDGSDPNQKSFRSVKNYTAATRSIEIRRAPDFTVTTADTITLLTTDPHVFTHSKDVIGTIEGLRGHHTAQPIGNVFYVDTTNGASFASGARGGVNDPLASLQDCEDNLVIDSHHDVVFILAGASGQTIIDEAVTLAKRYTFWRGPGRDVIWTRTTNGNTIAITGDGIEISGVQIGTHSTGSGNGIDIMNADFVSVRHCWILDTRGDGVKITTSDNCIIEENNFAGTGVGGSGQGVHIVGTAGTSNNNNILHNHFSSTAGDAVLIEGGVTNDTIIAFNAFTNSGGWGINITSSSTDAILHDNTFGNNTSGDITDAGTNTIKLNNEQWAKHSIATEVRLAELDAANLPSDIDDILADTANMQPKLGTPVSDVSADIAAVDTAVADVQSRLPAALISGRMDSDVNALVGQTGAATRLERLFSSGHHGVAQGGTAGTITLALGADTNNNFYRGSTVVTSANTGKKQYRFIHAYDGPSRVASVTPDWIVTPNNTTEYATLPFGFADTVAISGVVEAAEAVTETRLAELDAANLPANIDDILLDTNELQTDWADAGRLDVILDARMAEASINTTGGAINLVALVTTTTTNADMRGTDDAATATNLAIVDAVVAAIKTVTDLLPNAGALTDLATPADILTTALTESYAADGVAPTLAQIQFMIWAFLSERSIVTTTQTSKKLDGSTSAMTHTLDDETSPTSITRAT